MKKIKVRISGDDERGYSWQAWTFHGAQCLAMGWRTFKTQQKCLASIRNFHRLMQGEISVERPFDWKTRTQPKPESIR